MKITYVNEHEIPGSVARCVELSGRQYSPGSCDYTVTELIGPPRIRALSKKVDHVRKDVSDELYSAEGHSTHYLLELLALDNPDRYLVERRWYREIDGIKIGGQVDLWDRDLGRIEDWKRTRWASYANGVRWEWIAQLNIYRWLMADKKITGLFSVGIFKDYSKSTYRVKPPHKYAQEFPVAIWSDEEVEDFLRNRIALHRQAEIELPHCTKEEMWQKDEKWAVEPLKGGRARKLFNSEEEAEEWRFAQKSAKQLITVHRPGECIRCKDWCGVASICEQWKTNPTNPENQAHT